MKPHHLLFALIAVVCVSPAFAQKKEARNVGNFTSISYQIPGKLILRAGSENKLEISGSPEMLSEIKTEVQGSRLVIESKSKWNWKWKDGDEIVISITASQLEALRVGGSGTVVGESTFKASNFSIDVSGSGDVDINIEASSEIDADISGSGDLNLSGKCSTFSSTVSGSGDLDLDLTVGNRAAFDISGSGDVKAKGRADEFKTTISGSSSIVAADFETNKADIKISGSGSITIAVKESIETNISGSGSVRYKGNPSKVNNHASGSGSVSRM